MKLIKITQESCRPCSVLNAMMDMLEVEADEVIVVKDFDTDENVKKYDIMSTPTLLIVDENDNVVDRVSGTNPPQISALFNKVGKL